MLQYLAKNNGEEEIKKLISTKKLTNSENEKIEDISRKIHVLGFALTCDWLKDCGCVWLAKPDAHIKGVVLHLKSVNKIKILYCGKVNIKMQFCHQRQRGVPLKI